MIGKFIVKKMKYEQHKYPAGFYTDRVVGSCINHRYFIGGGFAAIPKIGGEGKIDRSIDELQTT